ncbi:MAG: hypothetical protein LQ343_002360 [Gyalolechia ehrenbergii]|nr:MAG: hypothetical protein LQ343_002360 [Gyalolechia ehrenbergii]
MSQVTDWAEQQSSDSSCPANSKADNEAGVLAQRFTDCQPRTSRVYSISTLLKLRQTEQPARIELRIIPAALAESVFKVASTGPRSRLHENLDPRRQTQSSNLTGRSTNSEAEVNYDTTYVRPLRQPKNPPETSVIQSHAGFARFLKQHASPPHHRVTAGGRIVPAGPLAPPPMMNLPSINTVLTGPCKHLQTKPHDSLVETDRKAANNRKTAIGSSATTPLAQQNINVNAQKPSNVPHQVNQGVGGVAYPQYTQMQSSLSNQTASHLGLLPLGTIPLEIYPDGTSLVYLNGTHYHTYWNGSSVALRPVNYQLPVQSETSYTSATYPQATPPIQPYRPGTVNGSMSQYGTMNGPAHIQGQSQQPGVPQSDNPQALHSQLTGELNILDRFVALHMHELSQAQNAGYAAQRKQLVEQLDSLRVSTENSKLPVLANAPLYGLQGAPVWFGTNEFKGNNNIIRTDPHSNAAINSRDTPANIKSVSNQLSAFNLSGRLAPPQTSQSTCLSPDAPPFVPAGFKTPLPDYFGPGQFPGHNDSQWGENKGSVKVQSSTTAVYQPHVQSGNGTPRSSRIGSRSSDTAGLRTNIEHQAPPALPIVTWEDIQYASRPGVNPRSGPKIYCTTIGEFQEVLRRVREQAEYYGCKGGQSKDPAHDAEEDIRWAMADGDPIPLPKSPADHVANPRPWSWDDSAFNYRPAVAINPIGAKSNADCSPYHRLENVMGNTNHTRADNWVTKPGVGNFAREPTLVARSACHTSDLSSPSPLRQKPTQYGSHELHRSSFQSYSGNSNGMISNFNAPRAGHATTWISNDARFHQQNSLQKGIPRQIEHANRASSHSQQYQPYVQIAPKTPAKSKAHSGFDAYATGLSERSQGSQQGWAPSNPNSGRSRQWTSQSKVKRKDSWDSDAASNDSWLSTSDRDSRLLSLDKRITASQVLRQSFCEVSPLHGQKATQTAYAAPIVNNWTHTPSSRGRNSDTLSFDSQGIPRSDFNHPSWSTRGSFRAAKVNLPQTQGKTMSNQALQTSPSVANHQTGGGVKLNNLAPFPSNTSPQGFLRGMLKSPRYSAARIHQSEPFGLRQRSARTNERIGQNREKQHANKENIKSDGYQDMMGWRGRSRGSSMSSGELTNPWQSPDSDAIANKARSSLAASSHHAFGQLPQYDGAGDALMSANHQAQSTDSKVSGPSSRRRRKKNGKAKASEDVLVGQTVSREEQAKAYDVGRTDSYDYRGLTQTLFMAAPDQAQDMRVHGEHVDRYFDRLYEEELGELGASNGRDPVNQRRL